MDECEKDKPHGFFNPKNKYITKKNYEKQQKQQRERYEKEIKKLMKECCKIRQSKYYYAFNDIEDISVSRWDFIDPNCL